MVKHKVRNNGKVIFYHLNWDLHTTKQNTKTKDENKQTKKTRWRSVASTSWIQAQLFWCEVQLFTRHLYSYNKFSCFFPLKLVDLGLSSLKQSKYWLIQWNWNIFPCAFNFHVLRRLKFRKVKFCAYKEKDSDNTEVHYLLLIAFYIILYVLVTNFKKWPKKLVGTCS